MEIVGFILISGKIGAGLFLLWIIADVIIGFTLLTQGRKYFVRRNISSAEKLFEDLSIMVGALLLIFPGFVSDFLALPLLIPPLRHWIFLFLRRRHGHILDDLEQTSQHFARWNNPGDRDDRSSMKTIEGDFKKLDDDKIY